MPLQNGIHTLSRAEYDAIDRMNQSTLKHGLKSLAHLRFAETNKEEEEDKAAWRFGRCVHLGVLEPARLKTDVAVWGGGVRRGKSWDEFAERNAGKELLTLEEYTRCIAIQEAIRHNSYAQRCFADGAREVAVLWTDAETGLDCKALLDVSHEIIVELKSARDASPGAFGRAAYSYAYHLQAAFYVDAVRSVTGRELPYVMVVAESAPPHVVQVYTVPPWILELGRKEYKRLLAAVKTARGNGLYNGYSVEPMELQLPRWAVANEDLEDESTDFNSFGLKVTK
jgi:hypothetical protein